MISKETKWLIPGTESEYYDFVKKIRDYVNETLCRNTDRYFQNGVEQLEVEKKRRLEEDTFDFLFRPSSKAKKFRAVKPEKTKIIDNLKVLRVVHEYLMTEAMDKIQKARHLNDISVSTLISSNEIGHICADLIEDYDISDAYLYKLPNAVSTDVWKIVLGHIESNFHRKHKILWAISCSIFYPDDWLNMLKSQEQKFHDQKSVFIFYWTLYGSYKQIVDEQPVYSNSLEERCAELDTFHHNHSTRKKVLLSLLDKCKTHRIKLRVNRSEKELIKIVEKWTIFSIDGHEPLLKIDNIGNFVRHCFLCTDTLHEVKGFTFQVSVENAAHVIFLFRVLACTDFFLNPNVRAGFPVYKKIEFQYWLMFTFRELEGFKEDNVAYYFLTPENKLDRKGNYVLKGRSKLRILKEWASSWTSNKNVTVKINEYQL